MFGMGRLAKLTQPDETIPGSIWAFLASAIGSVVGGLTGSTPVIVQVGANQIIFVFSGRGEESEYLYLHVYI